MYLVPVHVNKVGAAVSAFIEDITVITLIWIINGSSCRKNRTWYFIPSPFVMGSHILQLLPEKLLLNIPIVILLKPW